uniref:CHCH domain-containing protein n=1 Tax=Arion vulgaris TaxID=1028688 RepID=A0A0B6ZPU2_9EUPU
MPRRGRSAGISRAPQPAPARTYHPPPPAPVPHAAPAPMMAQPKQPGLFAQMATTAAGVAVGSAVGHTIGAALSGGGGGGHSQEVAPAPAQTVSAAPAAAPVPFQQRYDVGSNPCQNQLQQFLECTQTQTDISLCAGFNEALKECKLRFGIQA